MILSDNETKVDLLNSEAIASTIVQLIKDRPDHPVTIGVHGDWGAGKSSILEMVEAGFEGQEDIVVIKFNGWRFQGFEDAKISLIEDIVTELIAKKSLYSKAKDEIVDIYKRIDWLKVAKKAGGLALAAFTGIPSPEILNSLIGGLERIANNPSQVVTKENVEGLLTSAKSLLKPKDDNKNVPKEISKFRKSFDKLLEKANIKQLIVLVDDLDRCLPETAIDILEAIRLFVFTTKTAFIIAADEGMIEYSVRKHFPDLPDSSDAQTYSRSYLEKLIQVPFKIPILGETETRIYVTLLLIGAEIGENSSAFQKLVSIARQLLKKPWESKPLDAAALKQALGDNVSAQNALVLSDQIGPALANGARGNPRQIKRFLNTLLLRMRAADARGFTDIIKIQVLAKLMIAERFLPRLFDQIATSAASSINGVSQDLILFEEQLKLYTDSSKTEEQKKASSENGSMSDSTKADKSNPLVNEWLSSTEIRAWASISPALAEMDLRPYIFIAKEKKDFFRIGTSLGHLSKLAENLLGSKLTVQMSETEVKKLTQQEMRQLFDALRGRIISEGKFDTQPAGIAGLNLLVKNNTLLQADLLDFLEALPKATLGPWAISGWETTVTDLKQKARLNALIDEWAKASNSMLKTAAQSVQKFKAH